MKRISGFAIRGLCFTLMTALAAVAANAQSVADAARQERARRQNTQSKIVVTNATMKPAPPAATPQPGGGAQPAASETDSSAAKKPSEVRDEKWWRKEFQTARENLKRAEDRLAVLQLDLNRTNLDYLQKSDMYNKENLLNAELAKINAAMESAKRDADQARQRISLLEEDLRRAGAPSGWSQ